LLSATALEKNVYASLSWGDGGGGGVINKT
jgi:hypothetical protein